MIKHIVMFKLNPEAEPSVVKKTFQDLSKLPEKVAVIREYEIGEDVLRSPRSWDVVLLSTFNDLDALQEYARHDDHVEVALRLQGLCEKIAVVDYEI
ncbi:MAG: Dabb family protein [Acidobacteriota bacterium]